MLNCERLAAVCGAAVLECILAEVAEPSGNLAEGEGSDGTEAVTTIQRAHVSADINADEELHAMMTWLHAVCGHSTAACMR